MKVAYVLNTYPAPSHSFIRREIRALERRGIQVMRLAMRPHAGELADSGDRAEAEATTHVLTQGVPALIWALFVGGLRAPARMYGAFFLALKASRGSEAGLIKHLIYFLEAAFVARRVIEGHATRLHAHFGTNATTVAMLAAHMTGLPFSFTVHGPEEFDKPAAIALATKIKRADFTVAISSFGRSQLCRLVEHRHWPSIKVVHCGIEPDHYTVSAPLPQGRPLRLVNIGRFSEQKGQLLLVDAMAQAVKQGVDVHLTLVGDGELRRAIERAITHAGLGRHITLAGWQDEAGVRAAVQDAHALVLPSFAEGLPMVVMEAMAAARPCIATWVAGIPELMQDGRTGWLVPAGDARALAEAIVAAANTQPDVFKRMGTTARGRVLLRHNIDIEAEKLACHLAQRPRTQPD